MLINITHHPHTKWSDSQLEAAHNRFGEITDCPFPIINPADSINDVQQKAEQLLEQVLEIQHQQQAPIAVHLMGEMSLVYSLLRLLRENNIQTYASTSERIVTNQENGSRNVVFKFNKFRPYW